MSERYLDKVYKVETPDEARSLYDDWAASYDAEIAENGYATPRRCAEALVPHLPSPDAPILDFGCGTGLSGLALRAAGAQVIDGLDLSQGMLDEAHKKGCYRALDRIGPDADLPFEPGTYAAIAAVGVISPGAAPLPVFDTLWAGLGRGGLMVISFNDHALEDNAYEGRVNEYVDCAAARVLHRSYGDHLPQIGLNSVVYVLEKK